MVTATQLDIRKDFPVFEKHSDLVYLDTGASALVPRQVRDAVDAYYNEFPVNIHRGMYGMSERATILYDDARNKVAGFVGASPEEIIFTSGTTHGINMVAALLSDRVGQGDNIVLTRMEHHANLIPWQQLAKRAGAELRFIELTDGYEVDLDSAKAVIDERTKIVSITMVSNVLGTVTPCKAIIDTAKQVGALTVLDGAQGIVHMKTDVRELDCDFLVFSGHKLYGPTGVGVLYGKKEVLNACEPFFVGGDMIRYVTYETAEWADVPYKFEAGTPHIAGVIGLGAAVDYVQSIGWDAIAEHEAALTEYAVDTLGHHVKLFTPTSAKVRSGVLSFLIGDTHPHDAGDILCRDNIAVRVGHHCAMPLIRHLGIVGTVRASFGIYNTAEDVDRLVEGIEHVKQIFTEQYTSSSNVTCRLDKR